jgi:hypothetical protein
LYVTDGIFFANVPESVQRCELGGYPVFKGGSATGRPTAVTASRSSPTKAAGFYQSSSGLPLCSPSVSASMSRTPSLRKALFAAAELGIKR